MIKIICVGKIKEEYFKNAIIEYYKRIKKYTKIKIIEVPDEIGDNKDIIMKKEAVNIEKYLEPKDYIISLAIEGKEFDSISFSKELDRIQIQNSNITFIIGGSYGIDVNIKNKSNLLLSFSKMTFPHQLFRIILLEQIYRSYRILNNEAYHK